MIPQKEGDKWKLDGYPFGPQGPRVRRKFKTRQAAVDFVGLLYSGSVSSVEGEAFSPVRDSRRLSDLVDQWYEFHGYMLKDAKTRYQRTLAICRRLRNPFAVEFTAKHFSLYRKVRLKAVSVETVNHETRYLRAVFNELSNLGLWELPNPLKGLRVFPVQERELAFLSAEKVDRLLFECAESESAHLLAVVQICLLTGARWGEANGLLRSGLLSDRVRFVNTKNGRNRTVPIRPDFAAWLKTVALPEPSRVLFSDCRGAFKRAVKRANLGLPAGQMTHVLRHTFASHFIMNGGDVVTLQKILGHTDLKITMRYAHLAPDYLQKAVLLSPLADFIRKR